MTRYTAVRTRQAHARTTIGRDYAAIAEHTAGNQANVGETGLSRGRGISA